MKPIRPRERHVEPRTLLDYLDHKLDAAARRAFDEHLGRPCAACREQLREVAALLETMRLDRSVEVPAWLHDRALAVFEGREQPSAARRLIEALAELVFDSRGVPLAAAMRRSVGEARRLRFALAERLLDCELEREGAQTQMLRGTFAADDAALWTLVVSVGGERRTARPDTAGSFAVPNLPLGTLDVRVEGPAGRFRLPAIEP